MRVRQLFDTESSTYTYLLADQGEAVLIDPVLGQIEQYLRLIRELNLTLRYAIDTHTHADHITALGELRAQTGCQTGFGVQSGSTCASFTFRDNERIALGRYELICWYTPGHTDDSYSFYLPPSPHDAGWLFTGDTLLIRGTGRTDFQNGNALAQWASLQRLLQLPDDTLVGVGHDYKGWSLTTLGEERAHNPRLQFTDAQSYADFMQTLKLPHPRLMDIAVPSNRACGNPT